MSKCFTIISDLVTQTTFKDLERELTTSGVEVKHEVIGDLIGGVSRAGRSDYLLIHISPLLLSRRHSITSLEILLFDLVKLLENRLTFSKTPILINLIMDNYDYISRNEMYLIQKLILKFNMDIIELAETSLNLYPVDLQKVFRGVCFNKEVVQKNYDIMGSPYSNKLSAQVSKLYKFHFDSLSQVKKKVIVVDADNTLWGGVIGEDGADSVKIDQHYPGAVFFDFQKKLLALKEAGYVLCLSTKNNLSDIEEVFSMRDMPLQLSDFVVVKANWEPKSVNIKNIAFELNVGEDSLIFVDDNPFEIDEVQTHLPTVECFKFDYKQPNSSYDIFKDRTDLFKDVITAEDANKTNAYKVETLRRSEMSGVASEKDFLTSLELDITYSVNESSHISRASQMSLKTNQFNLTTRRYSEDEIAGFMAQHRVVTFSAQDKYGDLGIIGLVILLEDEIDTFLLSCRAFGRNIESYMFETAKKLLNNNVFIASFIPTKKNMLVKDFYDKCGMKVVSEHQECVTYESRKG